MRIERHVFVQRQLTSPFFFCSTSEHQKSSMKSPSTQGLSTPVLPPINSVKRNYARGGREEGG